MTKRSSPEEYNFDCLTSKKFELINPLKNGSAKILFIGDIHIKHSNLVELEILTKKISEIVQKPDSILVAGDVLDSHEKIDSQLMNRAYNLISFLREIAPVYILVGNHDYINNQQFLTSNHWMNGMKEWKNIVVVDSPIRVGDFIMVPYVYPGRFVEALNHLSNWTDATCIFAHQEIKGCKMGALISTNGDEWDEKWPSVISGHIHEYQIPQSNVFYPGSAINHAFGCDSQGVYVFHFDHSVTWEKIHLGLETKKILNYKLDGSFHLPKTFSKNVKFSFSGTAANIASFKASNQFKILKDQKVKVVFALDDEIDSVAPKTISRKILTAKRKGLFSSIMGKLLKKEEDVELENDYKLISI